MFSRQDSVTTVKPKAAQTAFDKREEAKALRLFMSRVERRPVVRQIIEKHTLRAAKRADVASNEALEDRETPRKVTATKNEMKQVAKVAAGSVDSKP